MNIYFIIYINSFLFLLITLSCSNQHMHQVSPSDIANKDLSYQGQFHQDSNQKIENNNSDRIQPYTENLRYWQYKGEPVLLLGASDQDNLFNHPDIWPFGLESHLDLMVKHGGNYVRNTMSSRDHGNPWPFEINEDGLYDLNTWNEEYWTRFEEFLRLTYERDIIVQIEKWDRFDYAREPWELNPYNPKNNVNYTSQESGLPEAIETHPGQRENPFFRTPPDFEDYSLILEYQQAHVEKFLSISLDYPHVLYCISNETNESPLWSDYWAHFILERARELEVSVHVTEMWDSWDLSDPEHDATFEKPGIYTYVDISQNNHQDGQIHWDNAQKVRSERLAEGDRPMNSVKIYGGMIHGRSFEEGTQRFWRNIFGGFASSRFHRSGYHPEEPMVPYGIGLLPYAQTHLRSLRMFTDRMNVFVNEPSNHLLSDRDENEAYAFTEEGLQYAVYFPQGGSVVLDLSAASGNLSVKWLDIINSEWLEVTRTEATGSIALEEPGQGPWAVLLISD